VGRRRASREVALRALYQTDVGKMGAEEALAFSSAESRYSEETLRFARELVLGCLQHRVEIDQTIARHARGWTLARMAHVDRNVLRLAVFEILHRPDVPAGVAVNEAVELAKKYSTAESGRFVNGVLGDLVRTVEGQQTGAEG